MKGFMGHGIRSFRENRDHPPQDGRRSTRRFGGTFYLWLFSMLLIVMIPLIGSEWIRERASSLLLEERMKSETSLVETMAMVADREFQSVSRYAASMAEDEKILSFLSAAQMNSAEEKMLLKQAFDAIHLESNRPAAVQDVYLLSLRSGYLVSAREGANAENSALFDYEKNFGLDRETFWNTVRSLRSTALFLPGGERNGTAWRICCLRVVVERSSASPLGYVLISYQFPKEILSDEEDGALCGLMLQDGRCWDMTGHRFFPEEDSAALLRTEASGFVSLRGKEYLLTRKHSGIQDWEYLRLVSSDLFYGNLRSYQRAAALCLLGCLLLCFLLALLLSRRNYHPVIQLVENLQKSENRKEIRDVNFQWIEERYQGLQASHDWLSGMLEQEKNLIVNNLFCRLLKGYYHSDYEVENVFAPYLIAFWHPRFRLILWSLDEDADLAGETENGADRQANAIDQLLRTTAETATERIRQISEEAWPVLCDGKVFILCNYAGNQVCLEKDFQRCCEETRSALAEKTGVAFSWFISAEKQAVPELSQAYMSCIEQMRQWNLAEERGGETASPAEESAATENNAEEADNRSLPETVMAYVHAHLYDPDLSLTKIGNAFHVSESHLSRLIRREYDIQLMSYVNAKRIERVAWLLDHTEMTLSDIAQETGFSTYRTMLRVFGQYYPVTPTQYRKEKKGPAKEQNPPD